MKPTTTIIIAMLGLVQAATATIVLRYDEPRPYLSSIATQPGTSVLIPYYDEQGFRTKAFGSIPSQPPYNSAIGINGPNNSADSMRPNNDTAHMAVLMNGSVEIFPLEDLPFRAITIDLAEYSTFFSEPRTIVFEGVRESGGSVFTTFITDGIIEGGFSTDDFETFYFPPEFTNLTMLRSSSTLYAFDNVTLTIIPEPAPLVLLALPALGWCCLRRRRTA